MTLVIALCSVSLLIGLMLAAGMLMQLHEEGDPVSFTAIVVWSAIAVTWPLLLACSLLVGLVLVAWDMVTGW